MMPAPQVRERLAFGTAAMPILGAVVLGAGLIMVAPGEVLVNPMTYRRKISTRIRNAR